VRSLALASGVSGAPFSPKYRGHVEPNDYFVSVTCITNIN